MWLPFGPLCPPNMFLLMYISFWVKLGFAHLLDQIPILQYQTIILCQLLEYLSNLICNSCYCCSQIFCLWWLTHSLFPFYLSLSTSCIPHACLQQLLALQDLFCLLWSFCWWASLWLPLSLLLGIRHASIIPRLLQNVAHWCVSVLKKIIYWWSPLPALCRDVSL